jgi:hypothetical protein
MQLSLPLFWTVSELGVVIFSRQLYNDLTAHLPTLTSYPLVGYMPTGGALNLIVDFAVPVIFVLP